MGGHWLTARTACGKRDAGRVQGSLLEERAESPCAVQSRYLGCSFASPQPCRSRLGGEGAGHPTPSPKIAGASTACYSSTQPGQEHRHPHRPPLPCSLLLGSQLSTAPQVCPPLRLNAAAWGDRVSRRPMPHTPEPRHPLLQHRAATAFPCTAVPAT